MDLNRRSRSYWRLTLLWLVLFTFPALAASKGKGGDTPAWKEERTFYKYRLNSGLGARILTTANFSIHTSFPIGFFAPKPLFIGPVVDFSTQTNGYTLATLVGAWYEFRIKSSPRLGVWLGFNTGLEFSSASGIASQGLAIFADGALVQEVDDLVSVKAQFRPGLVGGAMAFYVSFCFTFRFY
jgi:hypothetical protein